MKRSHVRYYSALISLTALICTQTFFQLAVPSVYADTGTGAVSLTSLGSPATQDFNSLANTAGSTTNATLPTGWYMTESGGGARDNEQYAVDTGGSNTGDTFSYGAAASTERALGGLRSGTLIPVYGAKFTNNTGSAITSLQVAYTGEQWRLGTAARTDRIDFQISTDATDLSIGTYTDVNALDFTTPNTVTAGAKDGNAAANRTALLTTISLLNIPNGASFFIRWTDLDATGADDGLSIDDFSITPQGGGGTGLSGVGAANPGTVLAGGSTLLTVAVTPATSPDSTGIGVTGDLSAIGGTVSQQFFDDATNGDAAAGDNVFSFQATVAPATPVGAKNLPTTITDAQARSANANIALTVTSSATPPTVTGAANPTSVAAGNTSLLTASVTPGTNPASTGLTVSANLSTIGGSANQAFFDNATNGDVTAGDNVFSYNATVGAATSAGAKSLPVTVSDAELRTGNTNISLTVTAGPVTGQPLPFSQNWSNTGLITANNDWSGVPGIVGYLGDYSPSSSPTGVDPQTLTGDFATNTVSVLANQTDTAAISGGVFEFEIANPAVALQGSGTADAPHIVLSVNTTGASNVTVSYNLRDIDGTADNSIQPVALQYRIGATGSFTNVPGAFVADASSGPSLASLVTPVGVLLPAAVDNQSLVQLRIITSNAFGSDEWIAIDDISVQSNGTIPLSASGSAAPSNVAAGTSTLLKVSVNPATNPLSTGVTVAGDLSSIGGSATQQFFDDATNGDVTAADNIFSFLAPIPVAASSGNRTLPISVSDAQTRTASTSIGLIVSAATDPQLHLTMGNPSNATTDVANPTNYLLLKNQYVMSYHRDRGIPNWVSWHLDTSWIGGADRQDDFRPDPSLPAGWYQVTDSDYSGSGFNRGHLTPSGDRTRSIPDNSATFFMTNMMPQAGDNNQGPWEELEAFARTVAGQGNELYIIGGSVGVGGIGENGPASTIAGGNVTVPAYTWKVLIILPSGDNDVSRVTTSTRTIAVIMPNRQGILSDPWQKYLATVDQVEEMTGHNFFSNVPDAIQDVIEAQLDSASNTSPQNIAGGTFANLAVDGPNTTLSGDVTVTGTLTLGGSYLTTGANKIILGPNATVSRINGRVIGSVEKQFDSLASPNFVYPVGTVNGYSPLNIQLTALSGPSSLTVRAVQGAHPNAPDPAVALLRYWDLTETGDLTAGLTFNYLEEDRPPGVPSEATFTLRRYDGSVFTPIPATLNVLQNTAATNAPISDFSDWTMLGTAVPTAADVTVSGRVTNANGYGLSKARVTLSDGEGNVLTAITNPFGYYFIDNAQAGSLYVVSVSAKRHSFESRTISLVDSLADVDFQSGQVGF